MTNHLPTEAATLGSTSPDVPPKPAAFAPGQVVAECFRIDAVLGAGAMGVVYKATHLFLDRVVALKVHRAGDHGRLAAEARAMARLSHPNVVGIYDVRAADEGLCIAMEFIDGVHARAWLAERKRSFRERLQMCIGVAEGLVAAHEAGIVHRDLKPENVMISRTGRVAVADFGLAIAPGESGGEMIGTPAYMAPEQFAGKLVDARTDQFSFCVLLHEVLYGVRPFSGTTIFELARQVTLGEMIAPPENSEVTEELRAIILRGLQRDPAARFPTLGALLSELRATLRAPARRAVGLAVAIALVVAGLVAVGIYLGYGYIEDARARAVARPQLDRLRLGEVAHGVSAELLAESEAQFKGAEAELKRQETLRKVREGDWIDDPNAFDDALEDVLNKDTRVGSVLFAVLEGALKRDEKRGKLPYNRVAWDGRSTLHCAMNDRMAVEGVRARVDSGPAIQTELGCRLRLIDCSIEADTIIEGSARDIRIEGGKFRAREHLVVTALGATLSLQAVEVEVPTKGATIVADMRNTVTIVDSTLRGEPVLEVGMHTQVSVRGGKLIGDRTAIQAGMHAKVQLDHVDFEGAIEREMHAVVEEVP